MKSEALRASYTGPGNFWLRRSLIALKCCIVILFELNYLVPTSKLTTKETERLGAIGLEVNLPYHDLPGSFALSPSAVDTTNVNERSDILDRPWYFDKIIDFHKVEQLCILLKFDPPREFSKGRGVLIKPFSQIDLGKDQGKD